MGIKGKLVMSLWNSGLITAMFIQLPILEIRWLDNVVQNFSRSVLSVLHIISMSIENLLTSLSRSTRLVPFGKQSPVHLPLAFPVNARHKSFFENDLINSFCGPFVLNCSNQSSVKHLSLIINNIFLPDEIGGWSGTALFRALFLFFLA